MSGLGCEKGILFMKLEKPQEGSDLGRKSSVGSITLWSWGSPAWCPHGVDGPVRRGTNGHPVTHRDECWGGEGAFGSSTGRRTLRGSGQASEEVTAQWPGG